jgi:hypothetical protein
MWKAALALLLTCSACGARNVPTIAAVEVPLPTASERAEFLALLSEEAQAQGFHVDASSAEELQRRPRPFRHTIHAAVWRGDDDDEAIASIMDDSESLGRPWLIISESEQPERVARFSERVMRRVRQRWPGMLSVPVMPTGVIPSRYQLQVTEEGYKLRPEFASEYQISRNSPLVAH